MTLKNLYKFYNRMIKEGYSEKDIDMVCQMIAEKEDLLLESSATGGPSGSVGAGNVGYGATSAGMGPVQSSQPSRSVGSLNGLDWINGGGKDGSGDISAPYNPSGPNRIFQKIPAPMGKNHGSSTGKKSRVKGIDLKAIRNMLSKKQDNTMGQERPKKVMNFDDFAKGELNQVSKVKEGKSFKATKSPIDKTVGKDGLKLTNRIATFQTSVKDHVKSLGSSVKQVGNDYEVHKGDKHIAQVMFRDDYIGVKKVGDKFPKEFKYNELGKIKSNLTTIIKNED